MVMKLTVVVTGGGEATQSHERSGGGCSGARAPRSLLARPAAGGGGGGGGGDKNEVEMERERSPGRVNSVGGGYTRETTTISNREGEKRGRVAEIHDVNFNLIKA